MLSTPSRVAENWQIRKSTMEILRSDFRSKNKMGQEKFIFNRNLYHSKFLMPRIGSFGPSIRIKYELELDHVIRVAVNKQVFGETKFTYLRVTSTCSQYIVAVNLKLGRTKGIKLPLEAIAFYSDSFVARKINVEQKSGGELGPFGVQGWRSGESTRLQPMWPGFDSQIRRHMWVEFVGSLLCTERFSPGTPVFPLLKNQNLT